MTQVVSVLEKVFNSLSLEFRCGGRRGPCRFAYVENVSVIAGVRIPKEV